MRPVTRFLNAEEQVPNKKFFLNHRQSVSRGTYDFFKVVRLLHTMTRAFTAIKREERELLKNRLHAELNKIIIIGEVLRRLP